MDEKRASDEKQRATKQRMLAEVQSSWVVVRNVAAASRCCVMCGCVERRGGQSLACGTSWMSCDIG